MLSLVSQRTEYTPEVSTAQAYLYAHMLKSFHEGMH